MLQPPATRGGLSRPTRPLHTDAGTFDRASTAPARPAVHLATSSAIPSGRRATAASRYQTDGTAGMAGGTLVVALFERLLTDLERAGRAVTDGRVEDAHHNLLHAQAIVDGVDGALQRSSFDGAEQLGTLYRHLGAQLVRANMTKDRQAVTNCRRLVEPLLEMWRDAFNASASNASGRTVAEVVHRSGVGATR
ncbi:MAG: flagellar export chaperone FliS [Microthrixaceae bacterium]